MSYAPASPDLSSFYSGPDDKEEDGRGGMSEPTNSAFVYNSSTNPRRPPSAGFTNTTSSSPTSATGGSSGYQNPSRHLHTTPYQPPSTAGYSLSHSPHPSSISAHYSQPQTTAQRRPSYSLSHAAQSPTTQQSPGAYYPSYSSHYQHGRSYSQSSYSSVHQEPARIKSEYPTYSPRESYFPPSPIKTEQSIYFTPDARPKSEPQEYTAPDANMPPRRSAAAAAASTATASASASPSAVEASPATMVSPVKTRFPTARIKRIMQADEEVGKVAQQTPIAVGKALEMFMVALVSKSHGVAKDKGAKRVTAQHLKQVIESDDQWDFLRDIVGRVSDAPAPATAEDKKPGGRAAKAETSSDEEVVPEVKKKGRGGRKKKVV